VLYYEIITIIPKRFLFINALTWYNKNNRLRHSKKYENINVIYIVIYFITCGVLFELYTLKNNISDMFYFQLNINEFEISN